jgi:hypothetical protein
MLAESWGNVTRLHDRLQARGVKPLVGRRRLNTLARERFGEHGLALLRKPEVRATTYSRRRTSGFEQSHVELQVDSPDLGLRPRRVRFPSADVERWAASLEARP